jgi:hypothetical protein
VKAIWVVPFLKPSRPIQRQQHSRRQLTLKTCAAASVRRAHCLDRSLPDPTAHVQTSSLLTKGSATSIRRRHRHMIMLDSVGDRKSGRRVAALEKIVQSCHQLRLRACPRSVANRTQAKKASAHSTKASAPILSKSFALALFVDDAGDEDDPSVVLSVPVAVAVVADPSVPIIHRL